MTLPASITRHRVGAGLLATWCHLAFITLPDPSAGRRRVYTVWRIDTRTKHAEVIGREIDMLTAEHVIDVSVANANLTP